MAENKGASPKAAWKTPEAKPLPNTQITDAQANGREGGGGGGSS